MDAAMTNDQIVEFIDNIPDEVLARTAFTMPWQPDQTGAMAPDPDGKPPVESGSSALDALSIRGLQKACWDAFSKNPQLNTSVRGQVGRIVGLGFEATSEIQEIQDVLEEIEYDWRNRLYDYWRQFIGRSNISYELHLILTVHPDGFIEVDYLDPATLDGSGDDDTGIIFHPKKRFMPLFYNVRVNGSDMITEQIPSIFVARSPGMAKLVSEHKDFDLSKQTKVIKKKFKEAFPVPGRKTMGYSRFVVSWNRGFMTRRAISHLRTVLEWINHYETLKKFEIDHKKASGAYAWVFSFDDIKAFRTWIALSDADRKKTAIVSNIVPGSRLYLPPGMKVKAEAPQLPKISDQDTDIMQMIVSGLNESSDVTTGDIRGTYASVKATRGPMSDRTSDEVAYFDRFYRFDFWGSIFFLKHKIAGFPLFFKVKEAVSFEKNEAVFKMVKRKPEWLIDVSYPISDTVDLEGRVKAIFGSKHGPLSESAGISHSESARKIGIGGYGRQRLKKATEDEKYPKLVYLDDSSAEKKQENNEGE